MSPVTLQPNEYGFLIFSVGTIVLILGCALFYYKVMYHKVESKVIQMQILGHDGSSYGPYKARIKFLEEKISDMERGREKQLTPAQKELFDNMALLTENEEAAGE